MRDPEFDVSTVTCADPTTFLKDIDHAIPDVILLCEPDALDQTQTFELLQRIPAHEHLRVIVIRQDDNTLEVYDKRCLNLTHNTDLITLIKHR